MKPEIEAVLLTGGASRRMGRDKAAILVDGQRADAALAGRLRSAGLAVTVLGRSPVGGCAFLQDAEDYQGPAQALSRFRPSSQHVFVLACDVLRFDPALVDLAVGVRADHAAVVPVVDGFRQPLCALYSAECLEGLREMTARGGRKMQRWLDGFGVRALFPEEIAAAGLDPRCVRGANTPEELLDLLGRERDEG